jgi:hypothetical protein
MQHERGANVGAQMPGVRRDGAQRLGGDVEQ